MQNISYIDYTFREEDSFQYVLSIRYATDGLSFCIHDAAHRLLAFHTRSFGQLDSEEAVIAKTTQLISNEPLLGLKYKKVFLLLCRKDKLLMPADYFSKNTAEDLYRLCLPLHTGDTLFYRKVRGLNSYMVETLPGDFARFLNSQYPSLSMVNSAYPFILCSLSGIMFNTPYLFVDIHERYFDLLVTRSNEVLLFNSFAYGSIPDIIYHALNCLQQCRIDLDNLQTALSGNWVNDSAFLNALQKYIPNISVLNYAPLSQWVKQNDLNNSEFIHLLNIHKCE